MALIGNVSIDVVWELPHGFGGKYVLKPHRARGGFVTWAADQLAALCLPGTIVTAVGPDSGGAFFVDDTRRAGLDVGGIRTVSAATRVAQVVVHQGERTILIEQGVHARWCPAETDRPVLSRCGVWLVGGTLDEPGADDPVLRQVLEMAGEHGKKVALNPTRLNNLAQLDLSTTSLVQVSEDDRPALGFAAQASPAEVAEAFLCRGAPVVIVTAGASGARAFTAGGESVVMPAVPVTTPRYPVGVGDSVLVVHAWALLLQHLDLYCACNYATAAGAHRIATGQAAPLATLEEMVRTWPPEKRFRTVA